MLASKRTTRDASSRSGCTKRSAGESRHAGGDELGDELEGEAALLDALTLGDVADPVVRWVGADEDEVAGAEGADMAAGAAVTLGRRGEMQLVLRAGPGGSAT
jgi:hypothetical protein